MKAVVDCVDMTANARRISDAPQRLRENALDRGTVANGARGEIL